MKKNAQNTTLFFLITAALAGVYWAKEHQAGVAPLKIIGNATRPNHPMHEFRYPKAKKLPITETLHEQTVSDPYRWMENGDSGEVQKWISEENLVTRAFLDQIPERPRIFRRIKDLWNFEKFSYPVRAGDQYFWWKNNGLQNQSVLYRGSTPRDEGAVLLDPNTLSKDGTAAISQWSLTPDGRLLAYGVSVAGSDWVEWKVRDTGTGTDHPDLIQWTKFSEVAWLPDGSGFYYSRYPEPKNPKESVNENQKVYFHKLGTAQSEDALIFERTSQPKWGYSPFVTDDGRYLILTVWASTSRKNLLFYKDLQNPSSSFVELVKNFEHEYSFVWNKEDTFYFVTTDQAPRSRLIAISLKAPYKSAWKEIIPQSPDNLVSVRRTGEYWVAEYLKDARSDLKVFDNDNKLLHSVALPTIGSVTLAPVYSKHPELFFTFTSYAYPTRSYQLDPASGATQLLREPKLKFDPAAYATDQVFYQSKDGTRIPMFISYKKTSPPNPKSPAYLYAYGGFNISLTPSFSANTLVWMEMGGIFAVPNLRGGGEYGEQWHEAGMRQNKQNVFDDFIAAAEYLVAQKFTSPDHLAIAGGSNGGLLVGAAMTQRPELFSAALPAVGVMDMLRFHKFTIGWAWQDEYGSPDNAKDFKVLHKYSPLHRLEKGKIYPSTLITTADHDDRVVPAHSFKYAAALQESHGGKNPVLIRIETRAGHGAGKPTDKIIEELTDRLAFIIEVFNRKEAQ